MSKINEKSRPVSPKADSASVETNVSARWKNTSTDGVQKCKECFNKRCCQFFRIKLTCLKLSAFLTIFPSNIVFLCLWLSLSNKQTNTEILLNYHNKGKKLMVKLVRILSTTKPTRERNSTLWTKKKLTFWIWGWHNQFEVCTEESIFTCHIHSLIMKIKQ